MHSASTESWASLEARSPSAEMETLWGGMTGPGPGTREQITFLLGVSGAERRPWPGRGSMITSEKLERVLFRSSVELLEEMGGPGERGVLRILLVGVRGSEEGTGGQEAVTGLVGDSSHSGTTLAGEALTGCEGSGQETGGGAAGGDVSSLNRRGRL